MNFYYVYYIIMDSKPSNGIIITFFLHIFKTN
jgi:hypothetical protein